MLKKSFFLPAQPRRAETRLFAKLRSRVAQRLNVRPGKTTVPTGDGRAGEKDLCFAPSLAAALLDGLFDHPELAFIVV
jgi:hypothetical protein